MFLVIFLYMVIASTFTIGKLALQYLQPIFLISIRMMVGGALLLGFLYFFRKSSFRFKKTHLWDFVLVTLFHIFFAFVTEFWALQYLNSSEVCLFYNLSPFITAVFSYLYFSEKITMRKLFGLLIGFFGFFPLLIFGIGFSTKLPSAFLFLSWPELMMLISVASASYGWIIVRKLGRQGYDIIAINGVSMFAGGLLALPVSFFFEGMPAFRPVSGSIGFDLFACIGYLLLLIFLANVLFYNLYGHLLKQYTATFLSFAGFLAPLFTALYGWIFIGESVGWPFFLTIAFVAFGLSLFYQEELRQGYIIKK